MRERTFGLVCFVACLAFATGTPAQEGHPLVGTWHGTWGPTAAQRSDVTLVIEYDGKALSGILNPGPDSARLQKATLDPITWTFRFEADLKQPDGSTAHAVVEAKVEDVTNRRRGLVGTWTQGKTMGDFKMTRDD